jgi:ribosomal-protein-alanine N-acetyltransferase
LAMIKFKSNAVKVEDMQLSDLPEVMEIERASFPLPWPTHAYRYELLENELSHYLVARFPLPVVAEQERNLWFHLRRSFRGNKDSIVVGYGGFWLLHDEVHISTLAVEPEWRRRGIGELLLLTMLDRAVNLRAKLATLEVRISNVQAQNLYHKYHFQMVGLRRRYYSDNNEDAFIMSVENIQSPAYRHYLEEHKADLSARLSRLVPGTISQVS